MAADVNMLDTTPQDFAKDEQPSFRTGTLQVGGPFRATELWNDIITHLKNEVGVKRRRLKMKSYDSCFTGADAVDVVLNRLQEERINFSKEVNREKALKLCQLLMENNVFESVSGKPGVEDAKTEFDDSSSKLFRFIDDDSKENQSSKDNSNQSNSSESSDTSEKTNSQTPSRSSQSDESCSSRHSNLVQELMDITGGWKRNSVERLRKINPSRLFQRKGSNSSCDGDTPLSRRHKLLPPAEPCIEEQYAAESSAVLHDVRQEVVIGRLLTIVDIPILDGILSFDSNAVTPHSSQKTLAYSNLAFKRQESLSSLFEKKEDDLWLEAATDCVECCPDGSDVLDGSFTEDTNVLQKLRVFNAITQHYSHASSPLWSDHFTDLQVALLNLLMQGRRGTVLQAMMLAMMLLPPHIQEEIYRIVTFMAHAGDPNAIRLSSKMSNHDRVEEVFTSCLIKNKVLAPHQASQLVWFMVDHREAVFSVPPDVEDTIHARLESVLHGRQHSHMELTYCYQVSEAEFRRQRMDDTQTALVELMNSILDDTNISLKDKKHRLKAFSKHHPKLHNDFFADMQ